jgi:hypothetical protein
MATGDEGLKITGAGVRDWFRELDQLLRGELTRLSSLRRDGIAISPRRLSYVIIVLAMSHGFCVGTFALFRAQGPSVWQLVASMVKVPLLFFLTLLVTFPSLYVFNALVGSRMTPTAVVRLLLASLGVMVAVLASLGPIVAFFSVSTTSYPFMVLFNVMVCGVSGVLGLMFLLQTLQRLSVLDSETVREPGSGPDHTGQREPASALDPLEGRVLGKHVKVVFQVWVIVFALVGAQMGWVLRPFIGHPGLPFVLFRGRESNFFQAVLQHIHTLFS